jgi:hypothetical protein
MSDSALKNQTMGYTHGFFSQLTRAGFLFTEPEMQIIAESAYTNLAQHCSTHRLKQRSQDPLKLYSFLLFATLPILEKRTDDQTVHIFPTKQLISEVVCNANKLIVIETSNTLHLDGALINYVSSLITHRGDSELGINPSGLCYAFHMLMKCPRLTKNQVLSSI